MSLDNPAENERDFTYRCRRYKDRIILRIVPKDMREFSGSMRQ